MPPRKIEKRAHRKFNGRIGMDEGRVNDPPSIHPAASAGDFSTPLRDYRSQHNVAPRILLFRSSAAEFQAKRQEVLRRREGAIKRHSGPFAGIF
jgi:hypothetical protein